MTTNQYKQQEKPKSSNQKAGLGRFFSDMLDGSMLTKNTNSAVMPFILYLSGLALFLIFNTYYAEGKAREADQLRREMTQLRIRYIHTKSEYMYLTQQSEIARQLRPEGFVESLEPPRPISQKGHDKGLIGRLFSNQ